MNLEKFLVKVVEKGIELRWTTDEGYMPTHHVDFAKYLTRFMEFGCHECGNLHPTHMRCCRGCEFSVGFFRSFPISLTHLRKYAKLFDEKLGFWTPKGCSLPREHRSITCVTYYCYSKAKFSETEKMILTLIRERVDIATGEHPALAKQYKSKEGYYLDKNYFDFDKFLSAYHTSKTGRSHWTPTWC
jgi:hypothetical protein